MKNKSFILSVIIIALAFLSAVYFIFIPWLKINILNNSQNNQEQLSAVEIMEIIKTDKDYNDLSNFIKDFEPEIVSYEKMGPNEYEIIKPEWQEKGFEDRITAIDKITFTDSTYWIELKNKQDKTKGLRMILDVKEKISLFLVASLSIEAGIGI